MTDGHTPRSWRACASILILATAVVTAGCTSDATDGTPVGATGTTPADVLGPANKATGSTIKVGVVNDGKSDTVDDTSSVATANSVAQYANEHLGGINGHVIEVVTCQTGQTPSGAATCASTLASEGVAVVLVSQSGQTGAVFKGLGGTGIPLMAYVSVDADLMASPGAFILTNPIAAVGAGIDVAKQGGFDHVAIMLPDVPSASGIGAITDPMYGKAGMKADLVKVPLQVADVTPQVQSAMSAGVKQFQIAGLDDFAVSGVKAMKQLGFEGNIIIASNTAGPMIAEQVPGAAEGIYNITSVTGDPNDPDVQLFGAVMDRYGQGTPKDAAAQNTFSIVLAVVRALTGMPDAVDATSIATALATMTKAVPLPLGGGMTFRCGAKTVDSTPKGTAPTTASSTSPST
jgi:ABC-type branched-subunit amino acid transport system substrate-binding protein